MSKEGLGLLVRDLLENDLLVRFTKGLITGVLEMGLLGLFLGVAADFLVIVFRFFLGSRLTGFLMTGPAEDFCAVKLNVLAPDWELLPKLRFMLDVEVTEGANLGPSFGLLAPAWLPKLRFIFAVEVTEGTNLAPSFALLALDLHWSTIF